MAGALHTFTSDTKTRRQQLKALLDIYKKSHLPVYLFHLGPFFIYGLYINEYIREDLKENVIDKRRLVLYHRLPDVELVGNDRFVGDIWFYLMNASINPEWE